MLQMWICWENLNRNIELLKKNMKINLEKTKTMVIGTVELRHDIEIDGESLK